MSVCSEQQRVGCAIGGIYTALAIEKVLPVMHSGPGCQGNAGGVLGRFNGGLSGVTYPDSIIPSTNFCEKDTIFGAADRLERLVEKTLEYYQTDMLLIVDGCTAEIVGDDIKEVAGHFRNALKPVLYATLPGFKGNNLWGHSQVLNAIIDQYLKPAEKINPLQVNVWGVVPYYDSLWINTLEQVEKTLRVLGLEPNIIYGRGKGIAAVDKISAAAFNLVLAPWTDLDIAAKLKTVFGTPYLHYPCLPIGPTETTRFIRALTEYARLDQSAAERYIAEEEDRYYFYIKNAIKNFSGGTQNPKGFYINSSAAMALSITRFLVNDWGFIPRKIFIIDDVKPEYQENIIRELRAVEYDGKDDFDIVFTTDGGLCDQELNREDFEFNKVCVFGTAWDLLTAKNKQLPFVTVSAPYGDFPSMNKSYFAYDGALTFLRDLYFDMTNKILGSGVVARFETGGH